MKTKMKRQGSTELPRFAVGALAIAGASAANAATVQITFSGSYISSTSGNNIDTDFGGDGVVDLFGNARIHSVDIGDRYRGLGNARGGSLIASGRLYRTAFATVGGSARFGSNGGVYGVGADASLTRLVAVSFRDAFVRSGALTTGYLELSATASQPGEKRIDVNRLIFDKDTGGAIGGLNVNTTYSTYEAPPSGGGTSAVPEASTSLGLLALGAGGILTRRRQKRAA